MNSQSVRKAVVAVGVLIFCMLLIPLTQRQALAAKFANQFIEFELPPQWQCNLEGAEWVCQNMNESKKRDAIIVLAAKLKGDQDTMEQYLTYLKAAKTYTSVQGKSVKSEPKSAGTVNINGQAWVDALHLESEIPGFYTRYLATVKQDIGVLVTYSINKSKYQEYLSDFDAMVKTLKVFHKAGGGLNQQPPNTGTIFDIGKTPNIESGTVFPATNNTIVGGADTTPAKKEEQGSSMLLIVVIGAALGYIIWRRRQNAG